MILFFLITINLYSFEANQSFFFSKDVTGDREMVTNIKLISLNQNMNDAFKINATIYKRLNYENDLNLSISPMIKLGNRYIYIGLKKSKKYSFIRLDSQKILLTPNIYICNSFDKNIDNNRFKYSLSSYISYREYILFKPFKLALKHENASLNYIYKNSIFIELKEKYSLEKEFKLFNIEYCFKIKDIIDRKLYFKFLFHQKYNFQNCILIGLMENINYSILRFDISKVDLIIKPFIKIDYKIFKNTYIIYKNEIELIHRFSSLIDSININMKICLKYEI